MWWTLLSLFLLLNPSQGLNEVNLDTECISAIVNAVTDFTFAGAPTGYYPNICAYNLSVNSLWAAAKVYCTPSQIEAGTKEYGGYCTEYGGVELVPYSTVEANLTDAYVASFQVVNYDDIAAAQVYNQSILISESLYKSSKRTIHAFSEEMFIHTIYGWAIFGFWGGLLLIGIINRCVVAILHQRQERNTRDIEKTFASAAARSPPSGFLGFLHKSYHSFKAHLVIPATFGTHHQQLLWGCTIPTRLESIIVIAYWVLNLALSCAAYDIFSPNLYYTDARQIWRYVADRTGIMCYANLPILWMFSGRNNIFIWATGWSFPTFNIFHRNVARVATIQAAVHAICYTGFEISYHGLVESWKEEYWYMGGMATVVMGLLLVCSSIIIRQKSYEIFLLLHIAFSVLVIVGLFYHTDIFDGSYNGYLWPLVTIWCFDRFLRVVRVLSCNFRVQTSSGIQHATSIAVYDEKCNVVRIEVTTPSKHLQLKPGQHYYLYQPLRWRGWENHPFTLASWSSVCPSNITFSHSDDSASGSSTPPTSKAGEDVEISSPTSQDSPCNKTPSSNEVSHNNIGSYKLIFYARPFSGWTKRLRDSCMKQPNKTINSNILIEGPYGTSQPLYLYENVLFITGGTGISGAISHLQDHIARSASHSTQTNNISLIFAAKEPATIHDILARELGSATRRSDVHATYFVTSSQESAASGSETPKSSKESGVSGIEINCGRPDVKAAVLDFVGEVSGAGAVGGRIAVLVCGPASMADEARAAVHQALKSGKADVAYFEESFGW